MAAAAAAGSQVMPVGGGKGGIYAQVWRLHPTMPYDAPYGGGGPASQTSDGAPFQTLNALILSYIDRPCRQHRPGQYQSAATSPPHPAGISVTAFDGLGTFTFSAGASYDIDGQIVSGSFSTTDSATLQLQLPRGRLHARRQPVHARRLGRRHAQHPRR